MSEEEIIQEIEKLELEEEKEKTVKYLLKVVIEGKKDIIQEKEFFLKQQQKEIEELKKDNEEQWEHRCKMAIELDNNVVSKDKIREKIQKYEKEKPYNYGIIIKVLNELLEE